MQFSFFYDGFLKINFKFFKFININSLLIQIKIFSIQKIQILFLEVYNFEFNVKYKK